MTLGDLIVKIGGDTKGFDEAVKKTQSTLGGFGEAISAGIGVGIGSEIFNSLQSGMAGVVNSFKEGIQYASDLKEVQNVVDTAFGTSAQAVNAWAQTTLANFGLTELQAKQMAGSMRAMLGSMGILPQEADKMSMSMAELAGDFASFYNLSHDEAWGKIRAGIAGETEPLKSLGINMSVANMEAYALTKGISTSWNAMNQSTQTMLRYNYLLEAGKNATGDFAKTQSSYANQLRVFNGMLLDFKGKMAEAFLPMGEKILELANKILPKLQQALKPIVEYISKTVMPILQNEFNYMANEIFPMIFNKLSEFSNTLKTSGIKEALKTLVPDIFVDMAYFIKDIFSWIIKHSTIVTTALVAIGTGFLVFKTITTLVAIATTAVSAFGAVMAFITSPIGIAVVAIGAIAGIAYLVYRNWQPIADFFKDLWSAVAKAFELGKSWIDVALQAIRMAFVNWQNLQLQAVAGFIQSVMNLFSKLPGVGDIFKGLGDAVNKVRTASQQVADSTTKSFQNSKAQSGKVFDELKANLTKLSSSGKNAYTALKNDITGSFTNIKSKTTALFGQQKTDATNSTDTIKTKFKDATDSVKTSVGTIDKGTKDSLKNAKKLAEENTKTIKEAFEKMKDEAINKTNKMGEAIITALKNQYAQQEKKRVDSLNSDLQKVKMHTKQVIREYEKELKTKMGLIDADTKQQMKAVQDEIDLLNNATASEEKALREQEYNNQVSNLQKELNAVKSAYEQENLQNELNGAMELKEAKSADEKEKIQTKLNKSRIELQEKFKNEQLQIQNELNSMFQQKERENLLAIRDEKIKGFEKELQKIQEQDEIKKQALQDEYDFKKTHEENMLEVKMANIEEELQAVKDYYADLTSEEKLQAQARYLFLNESNAKVITLLNNYNPLWQDAGKSWGQKLLEGIESKKKAIEDAVKEMLSLVDTKTNAFNSQTPIGPSFYSPKTGETFNPPSNIGSLKTNPTLPNVGSNSLSMNTSTMGTLGGNMNIQVNLDGRTIAKATAPNMVKELKLQGVYS